MSGSWLFVWQTTGLLIIHVVIISGSWLFLALDCFWLLIISSSWLFLWQTTGLHPSQAAPTSTNLKFSTLTPRIDFRLLFPIINFHSLLILEKRTQGIEVFNLNYVFDYIDFVPILDNSKFGLNCLGPLCHHLNWWRHLHWFQSWQRVCVTCIATLPWNALLALSVSIEFVSSSPRVTSV